MKNDQLSDKQIARLAGRAARMMSEAYALTIELPSELGTPVAEDFAQGAMERLAEALGDLAKIKRSLTLARIREKTSARDWLKAEAQKPRVFVPVPLPVRPYDPCTAIVAVPCVATANNGRIAA